MRSRSPRPRWQLTRRPRFAVVLGLAGLAVAGMQVLLADTPLPWFQLAVVVFWSVLGVAYLASALGQVRRERARPRHRAAGTTGGFTPVPVPVPHPPTRPFEAAGAAPEPAPEPMPVPEPRPAVAVPAPGPAESTDVRLSPWPLGAAVARALHAAVDSRPDEHTDVHALAGAGTGRMVHR